MWAAPRQSSGVCAASSAFAVDAGTGLLCDRQSEPTTGPVSPEVIVDEVLSHGFMAEPHMPNFTRLYFDCGMGDGVYDVWEGLSPDGERSCVVPDLELLSHGQPIE